MSIRYSLATKLLLLSVSCRDLVCASSSSTSSFRAASVGISDIDYGLDCSFPIHHVDTTCGHLLGDRYGIYNKFMDGCREYHEEKQQETDIPCQVWEKERMKMNRKQPMSMLNFTVDGYAKARAPQDVMDQLLSFWDDNREKATKETFAKGSVYSNYWSSPSYMVSVHPDMKLQKALWDSSTPLLEEWTGMELLPTNMHGIRVYTDGAILNPQVDHRPFVISAIINVAQDVNDPWVLEVYNREQRAVNVTMEPGDIVYYESGSLVHGRPFALEGRFYANLYLHFEPTGRTLSEVGDRSSRVASRRYVGDDDEILQYNNAAAADNDSNAQDKQPSQKRDFPPYLVPDSKLARQYAADNPEGWLPANERKSHAHKSGNSNENNNWQQQQQQQQQQQKSRPKYDNNIKPTTHHAAAIGDVTLLQAIADKNKKALSLADPNGWEPIHEAVRGGQVEAVQLLIENGEVEKDTRIGGRGPSPLKLAIDHHTEDHPVSQYLMQIGARSLGDEF